MIYEAELESLDFRISEECVEVRFVDKNDIEGLEVFESVKKLAEMFTSDNHR